MSDIENKKQTVKVVIFGEEYPIQGSADPEYILRVASYVDKKMREIASRSKNKSLDKIAILTALNIAGELLDQDSQKSSDIIKMEDQAKTILELLDSKLSISDVE
jgi:cell division protein ZapA